MAPDATYPFLSPAWLEAAHELREEYGSPPPPPVDLVLNLLVSDTPFSTTTFLAHMDSSNGALALAEGHHPSPDLTVTIEWAIAKALLLDGQVQAVMSAFMAGKIKVEGDMSKLVAMQQQTPDPLTLELLDRLRAITD